MATDEEKLEGIEKMMPGCITAMVGCGIFLAMSGVALVVLAVGAAFHWAAR